jgi:hypothetical protein
MPATVTKPTAFEQGDHLYIVAPVVPSTPTESEIEEYAFGKDLVAQMKGTAPNSHIAWFGGHYVEADRPNLNGAMWLAEDLAVASLSPTMMPVTVMHDPRTAVGVIAHAALQQPPAVPRSKIETALALWKHRFPEAVAEAEHNYAQGTLMQSMECLAPRYECSECRMPFLKLPNGAEKAGWCDHLKSSRPSAGYSASHDAGNRNASRILRGVTFTGTGLIFGTRGKVGADPSANLEAFQEEVAEFHEKAHRDRTRKPKPRSKSKMEIEDARYAELVAAEAKAKALETKVSELEATAAKVPDLEKKVTETEATAAAEKQRADEAVAKVTEAEEKANRQTLRDQRWEALGSAFTAKLDAMPTTKGNLLTQAETLDDSGWDARLSEIEEIASIKRDAQGDGGSGSGSGASKDDNPIFSKEEVASFGGGSGNGGAERHTPSVSERRSVVGKLFTPAKKS